MNEYQTASEIAAYIAGEIGKIKKVNGFETDIGLRVYRGRRDVHDDHVPCAVLIEGKDKVEQSASRREATAKVDQHYALGGYSPCDPDHPNDEAHKIIRDLKRAIFGGDNGTTLNGKVRAVEYKGRDIGPRTDGEPIVFAVIEITVSYVERLAAP